MSTAIFKKCQMRRIPPSRRGPHSLILGDEPEEASMGSRTDNVDLAELQKRRQKTLERLEGKPVEKAKPNSNNRPVIPRGGVGQLNLGLLDPRNPQEEYFADGYADLQDFQGVIANKVSDREKLSSLFTAWENIPKYNGSALAGVSSGVSEPLDIVTHKFIHDGDEYEMVLTPAQLQKKVKGKLVSQFHYPGLTEEFVELVLVQMSMEEAKLFDDPNLNSGRAYGVSFSLSGLKNAMSAQKKTRSYTELVQALNVLHKSNLELRVNGVKSASAPILPELYSYAERGYKKTDPSARWAARFHPLISMAISSRNYRQYNIERLMCTNSKAALNLSKMVLTQARNLSDEHPYRITYQEFVRHCGELNYSRRSDGIRKFINVAKALKTHGTLSRIEERKIRGWRNRVEDIELSLYGSKELIQEIKAGHVKERLVMERYEAEKKRLERQERSRAKK